MWQDNIPERAMVAGMSSSGGPLYVGRAHHEGGLFPGQILLYFKHLVI